MNVYEKKINRINSGGKPRVLDLFSGGGGLSLGFKAAGFEITGGVDSDHHSAKTFTHNFFGNKPESIKQIHAQSRNISEMEPEKLMEEFGYSNHQECIDLIIGGPPCQAFARIGRAKLRQIAEHPEAFLEDPRGNLYLKFIEYVEDLKPIVILMENVPDALNYGEHNIAEESCDVFNNMGYKSCYTILNSSHYGVPQYRDRMFLLAWRPEIGTDINFPDARYNSILSTGYKQIRDYALYKINNKSSRAQELLPMEEFDNYFVHPPEASGDLPPAITVREAIEDLPPLDAQQLLADGYLANNVRDPKNIYPYPQSDNLSNYVLLMRQWPGYESIIGVDAHVTRRLARDFRIFARMEPGDRYPRALEIARELYDEKISELDKNGEDIKKGSKKSKELLKQYVPPYDDKKFPDKWRKLDPEIPSHTITAHLSRDCYSHIHYDSSQARTITPREAARLQSFPDGFKFSGQMDSTYRMIGNAVPPLLAYYLAAEILRCIGVEADPILMNSQ